MTIFIQANLIEEKSIDRYLSLPPPPRDKSWLAAERQREGSSDVSFPRLRLRGGVFRPTNIRRRSFVARPATIRPLFRLRSQRISA